MAETVNHPGYYGGEENPCETIKVIESMGIGYSFCLGNAVKYLMRAGLKTADPAEDLRKAAWYVDRAISQFDTQDILSDPETVAAIREGEEALKHGAVKTLDDLVPEDSPWDEPGDKYVTVRFYGDDGSYRKWTELVTGDELARNFAREAARGCGLIEPWHQNMFGLKLRTDSGDGDFLPGEWRLRTCVNPGETLILEEL